MAAVSATIETNKAKLEELKISNEICSETRTKLQQEESQRMQRIA